MAIFKVGIKIFNNKSEVRKIAQSILHSYDTGQTVKESDAAFLNDLLNLHPEAASKIGCGVVSFQVEQNEGSRGFWLTRIDGTRTHWSFYSCLNPPTPEQEALVGFRQVIREQVAEVKNKVFDDVEQVSCPVTGDLISRSEAHVDHEVPFTKLVEEFLIEEGISLSCIKIAPARDGRPGETILADERLRISWALWHLEKAKLRVVSRRANLSVLRKKI